jgi:hypothetical protein
MGSAADVFQTAMLLPARWASRVTAIEQYLDDTACRDGGDFRHIAELLTQVGYDGPRLHPVADLLLACGCVLSVKNCISAPRAT